MNNRIQQKEINFKKVLTKTTKRCIIYLQRIVVITFILIWGEKMRIKELRINANLTQSELGSAVGCTQQAVAKWESGEMLPRANLLPKIADILKCSVDELCAKEEEV